MKRLAIMVLLVGGMFATAISSTQASPAGGTVHKHATKHKARTALSSVSANVASTVTIIPDGQGHLPGACTSSSSLGGTVTFDSAFFGTITLAVFSHVPGGQFTEIVSTETTYTVSGTSFTYNLSYPTVSGANSYRVQIVSYTSSDGQTISNTTLKTASLNCATDVTSTPTNTPVPTSYTDQHASAHQHADQYPGADQHTNQYSGADRYPGANQHTNQYPGAD